MNTYVNDLMQKRMDRKAFLKHVGIGVVVLTGFSGALKLLKPQHSTNALGYGGGAYGGIRKG